MSIDSQFVSEVLRNDGNAIRFLADATLALSLLDSVHKGTPLTPMAVWAALVELSANPFYRRHFDAIHPVLRMVALQRINAATIESDSNSTDDALMQAYVDNQAWTQLLLACSAALGGGPATAMIAPTVRRFGLGSGFQKYLEQRRVAQALKHPPAAKARAKKAKRA